MKSFIAIIHTFFSAILVVSSLVAVSSCQSDEKATAATTTAATKTAATENQTATKDSTAQGDTTKSDEPVRVSLTQAQYNIAAIELGQPSYQTLSTTLNVNGKIDVPAQNQVSVSVPVGGFIRQIKLEPGMRVKKGQPLVVLENPDYVQLQQDYLDTKAKLDYADLEFARQQELSRENVNALKVFQQTRSTRQSLQAQLAGLGQRLAILRINPQQLTPATLTRTIVVPSPVSGFVTDIPVNNGRFVNPSDILVQITNVDHLHVQLSIFEKDISRIHPGQQVRFRMGDDVVGAETQMNHRATIFLIGKSIANDRTIQVLAHAEGKDSDYIPGGYVTGQIAIKTQPLLSLPETAVVSYGGKSLIYLLESKQGTPTVYQFRQQEVKTGIRQNGYVAVTLPPDINPKQTPIVTSGAYSLLSKLNNSEEE